MISIIQSGIMYVVSSRPIIIGLGSLLYAPALELAYRTGQDLDSIFSAKKRESTIYFIATLRFLTSNNLVTKTKALEILKTPRHLSKQRTQELAIHAIATLVLLACAFNIFTGSAIVGSLAFYGYAKFNWQSEASRKNYSHIIACTGCFFNLKSDDEIKNPEDFTQEARKVMFLFNEVHQLTQSSVYQKIRPTLETAMNTIIKISKMLYR